MTTMIESCVSSVLSERLNDTLKFGFPVMVLSAVHFLKQLERFIAFYPKPAGKDSEVREVQPVKQLWAYNAFCPKPAGKDNEVREVQSLKHKWMCSASCPNPSGIAS